MGTRDCELSALLQIYTLPATLGSATHTPGQNRTKEGGERCERSHRSNGVIGLVIDAYKDE